MMKRSSKSLFIGNGLLLLLLGLAQPTAGQEDAIKQLSEARGFFALPLELDFDNGAANGNATILRIMPLYTLPLSEHWKLVNLSIIGMADAPGGTPAFPGDRSFGQEAGVSDLIHSSFVTPTRLGDFTWGVGAILAIPTATDDSLGSGKWAAGPAFRVTHRKGPWDLAAIIGQRWSFAGSDDRAEVNQLMIRATTLRRLPNNWFFVSSPLIIANWDRPEEKWLVPVGGGIGRSFKLRESPWAWSVQGYFNAIKADPDPDWVIRLSIISAIPFDYD